MKPLICMLAAVAMIGCSKDGGRSLKISDVRPPEKEVTSKFPTEIAITEFLKVGVEKRAVVERFGEPQDKEPQPKGDGFDEVYYYVMPPYRPQKDESFVYSGFQVYFIQDKVAGFSLIHRDVRAY